SEGRLEADHAAPGGGNADGAALVAADRDVAQACGHRGGGTRRGAAGEVPRVVRIADGTVIADPAQAGAEAREGVEVGLPGDDRAGRQDAGGDRGVGLGNEVLEKAGATGE